MHDSLIHFPARPSVPDGSHRPGTGRELRARSIGLSELRQVTPDVSTNPAFVPPGTDLGDQRTANPGTLAQTVATEIGEAQSLRYPFRCIGKVRRKRPGENWGGAGSGVLVGPWHLLTASHVLSDHPPGTVFKFIPAYWDGPRDGDIGFRWFEANIITTIGITRRGRRQRLRLPHLRTGQPARA